MSLNATELELNYLLDLLAEIESGLDSGVLDEIQEAKKMIEGWKEELGYESN